MLSGGLRGKAAVALAFRGDLGQRDRAPRCLVANASALEAQLGRIAAELLGAAEERRLAAEASGTVCVLL